MSTSVKTPAGTRNVASMSTALARSSSKGAPQGHPGTVIALRPWLFPLAFAVLLLLAFACGNDDQPSDPTATSVPTGEAAEPGDTGATAAFASPVPVFVPANVGAFLDQFGDRIEEVDGACSYDSNTTLVDCGDAGLYQLQDGLSCTDLRCSLMLVEGQTIGIHCFTDEPPQSVYYAVPEAESLALTNTPIEAAAEYVATIGLDGQTFELTEPQDCDAVEDIEAAVGKVCVDLADSQIGAAAGTIEVGVFGTEAIWELTLELQNNTWAVTAVEYTGS